MRKDFQCGLVVATPGAADILGEEGVITRQLLALHESLGSEWVPGQIISRHSVDGSQIWAVTELDAKQTTFLLPSEYLARAPAQGTAN